MVPEPTDPPRPARAHLRVPIDVFVRVAGADRDYAFRTRDLSSGGLFLYTRVGHLYPFGVGVKVAIELHDSDRVIALRGEVIRVVQPGTTEAEQYPAGFAVRLNEDHPDDQDALAALIARCKS
jgi:hypothetical protein